MGFSKGAEDLARNQCIVSINPQTGHLYYLFPITQNIDGARLYLSSFETTFDFSLMLIGVLYIFALKII